MRCMRVLEWPAAAVRLSRAISLIVFVAYLRSPGRRINGEAGWLLFDVAFGVTALARVLAEVDDAFYVLLSFFVLRRLAEARLRSRAETPVE